MLGPEYNKTSYGVNPSVKQTSQAISKSLPISNYNSSFTPFYLKRKFSTFTYAPIIYFSGCNELVEKFYKYFSHLQKPENKIKIDLTDKYEFEVSKKYIYTVSVEDNIDADIQIKNADITPSFVLNELFHVLREKTGAILFICSSYKIENTFIKSYCDLFVCAEDIPSEDVRKVSPLSLIVNLEVSSKSKLCIDKTLLNSELKCIN
jgi:hypothetical protein